MPLPAILAGIYYGSDIVSPYLESATDWFTDKVFTGPSQAKLDDATFKLKRNKAEMYLRGERDLPEPDTLDYYLDEGIISQDEYDDYFGGEYEEDDLIEDADLFEPEIFEEEGGDE